MTQLRVSETGGITGVTTPSVGYNSDKCVSVACMTNTSETTLVTAEGSMSQLSGAAAGCVYVGAGGGRRRSLR